MKDSHSKKISTEKSGEITNYYRALLDSTAEGMWSLDEEGRIVFVNQAALRLFRYDSAAELIGKNSHELAHYKHADGSPYPKDQCPALKVLKDGVPVHLEDEVLWRKDGTFFYADYRSTPLFHNGKISGVVTTFTDNSHRREIQEKLKSSEARFRLIADCLPTFVSYMDSSRKYQFVNRAYSHWFGHPAHEIEGKTRAELVGDGEMYKVVEPFEERALSGIPSAFELTLHKPTGEFINLDTEYLPVLDPESGDVRGIIGVGQDVTARKQALQESEMAKQRLHSLFMQAPIPIAVLEGKDLVYTLTNRPYESLVARQGLIGKKFREEWPELEAQGFFAMMDQVLATGETFQGTEVPVLINSLGWSHTRYFNIIMPAVRNLAGAVDGVMIFAYDVTAQVEARKKIEDSQAQYQILTDSLPNIIWTAGADGAVNYRNARCLEYVGIEGLQKLVTNGWRQLIHPDDANKVEQAWRESIASGQTFKVDYRLLRHDGEYRWFLGRATPVKDMNGVIQYWIGTATDINDERRIAEELVAAKNAAENANRTKTAFLANMSHEIRTPLGAVLGFSELIGETSLTTEERRAYIENIARNGRSLTRIIDDILDIAKVEAGHLETEEVGFSVSDLLNEVLDLYSDKAKQNVIQFQLRIEENAPAWIVSDPTRLRQILINVIGNAVKFTVRGNISIRVGADRLSEAWKFSIAVKDSGPGITAEQRARLFQPFTQADNSTTRRHGGTGLGLALSKRLAEALGGGIILRDEPHAIGAEFVISFKAKEANRPGPSLARPVQAREILGEQPLNKVRILLVDDSEDNQFLVKRLLERYGAIVDVANDGRDALVKAREAFHDVVLMDIQMPEMDGYQALAELLGRGYKTPVVALTAHALTEERERTKRAGFAGHLTKPVDKTDLLTTVSELLG